MNNILINNNNVVIETDIVYQAIEINFIGNLYITNNLPNDYLVKKKNTKILIFRFNNNDNIESDLFSYNGSCNITSAKIVDQNLQVHALNIKKPKLKTWNRLSQRWNGTNINWNKLRSQSRNDYSEIVKYKIVDGKKEKTTETQRIFNYNKKDKNLTILGNLDATNGLYKIKANNTPYNGKFHINIKTMKMMTGSQPNKTSMEIIEHGGSEETRYGDQIGNFKRYRK